MKSAPLPPDEADRLDALRRYGVLDTAPEQVFDDLVLLASQICQTPVALISLVDPSRQWFKARVGLTVAETSRHVSFCAHAILERGVMTVPDALCDERFADNPLVTGEPKIRFYAGAPLITPEGRALGTVCVIDLVPRELSHEQEAALQALSRQVVALLERQRLARKEVHLTAIVESADDAVIAQDLTGRIISWNRGAEDIFGHSAAEAVGQPLAQLLIPQALQEEESRNLDRIRRGERVEHYETMRLHKDGRSVPVSLTVSPIQDSNGAIIGASKIARDISERKAADARLQESEDRYRHLVDISPVGILVYRGGRLAFINGAGLKILGALSADQLLGKTAMDIVHPDCLSGVRERIRNVTEKRQAVPLVDEKFVRVDGTPVKVQCVVTPMVFEGQDAALVFFNDITERKRVEAQMRSTEAMLQRHQQGLLQLTKNPHISAGRRAPALADIVEVVAAILEVERVGVWLLNRERTVFRCLELYLRSTRQNALGQEFVVARYPAYFSQLGREHIVAADHARTDSRTKDLAEYYASVGVTSVLDVPIALGGRFAAALRLEHVGQPREWKLEEIQFAASIANLIAFACEADTRRELQEALQRAKETAEAANLAKTEFLTTMSHEIRTPMNAIVGMADLLSETTLDEDQEEYVQIFRDAASRLLNLINDVLDLSKIEAGHFELDSMEFDLHEVVQRAAELVAPRANEKELELACHVKTDVPAKLIGDPNRLRQVLINLLGNAVKFTESGEVVLRVERDPDRREGGCLRFSVRDTGIGIPPEKLEAVFQRFVQVDSSITRQYGGTGLGLAISCKLVEGMGGRIWVESAVWQGSTFFFTARYGVQAELREKVSAASSMKLAHLRTLVVDDNDTNRLIARESLFSWGIPVKEASGGEEALRELLRAGSTGTPYHVVILDGRMPRKDGWQVAECINQNRRVQSFPAPEIIMLTSERRAGDRARARELGVARHLTKPYRRSDLFNAMVAISEKMSSREAEARVVKEALDLGLERPLNILLVEDFPDNRRMIEFYFKHTPHRVEMAEHGGIAVSMVKSRPYDLVLMDVQMPVMDGYTATKAIRRWEREHGRTPVPIIALTAHALKDEVRKSREAGCTAYLTKPIRKAKLLATVRDCLAEPSAAVQGTQEPEPIVVEVSAEYKELMPGFMENRRRDLQRMAAAIEQHDLEAIRMLAHDLKGAGGTYGLDGLSDAAHALEIAVIERDLENITDCQSRLTDYLDRLQLIYV